MSINSNFLDFKNVTKSFGQFKANDNISFSVEKNSIHAIVGENGAGKSTLMKILFGLYRMDSGQIFFNGKSIKLKSPVDAKKSGIGMVHQHFMLSEKIPALDHFIVDEVTEGLFSIFKPLNRHKLIDELEVFSRQFNMPIPWNENIENLSVGIQQRIEILKLLRNNSELLILDEPTAVLTPQEIELFFDQLADLKSKGKTIIIITHKIKEVLTISDQVTVLRQGKVICTEKTSALSFEKISELMIGKKIVFSEFQKQPVEKAPVIEFKNLNFRNKNRRLQDISFKVNASEIVGIAGVEGNGQSEIYSLLTLPSEFKGRVTGNINFFNQSLFNLNFNQLKELGFGYFPEDRLHQGIIPQWNVAENLLLGQQRKNLFSKLGFLKWKFINQLTQKTLQSFKVFPDDYLKRMGDFSGGNQQKFVVARELEQNPKFLVAAHPTRGVDIGAIESIHENLILQKKKGTALLLISSELEELMKLSDRILVMFDGKIAKEFSFEEFNEKAIGQYMLGKLQ